MFEKRVKLFAVQVGFEFLRALLVCADYRSAFDGVELDSFLTLGNSRFEVSAAQGTRSFVAYGKERNQFCKVILVAILLGDAPLFIGFISVVEGVVASSEGVPKASASCILLRRARREQSEEDKNGI